MISPRHLSATGIHATTFSMSRRFCIWLWLKVLPAQCRSASKMRRRSSGQISSCLVTQRGITVMVNQAQSGSIKFNQGTHSTSFSQCRLKKASRDSGTGYSLTMALGPPWDDRLFDGSEAILLGTFASNC